MKLKRFYFIGAVLVAAVAAFTYQNRESTQKSDLALENIEALSDNESTVLNWCKTYCKNLDGYECVLQTNTVFNVTCEDMAHL